jgi:Flp pilus assembly protein TadG
VAAVEFAILLPVLLLIVFGITEFGRALYNYNTLVKAARDAARYYAAQQPGNPPAKDTEIKNLAVYGNTAGTGNPLAPGLATTMVTLCDSVSCTGTHQSQGAAPVVNLVTVTISGYAFQSFVPFVTANLSSFTFAPISTTMEGNL